MKGVPELSRMMALYGERLPQKIDDIADAVAAARRDRALLPDARALAHKLRGTAGSYGYGPVGEAAGVIEEAIIRLGSGVATEAMWAAVDQAVDAARVKAAQAAGDGSTPSDPRAS